METRPYFIAGDLAATLVAGAVCGLAGAAVVVPGWNMLLAMVPGMAIGMLLALPLAFLFMPFFGAMEIMVPTMLAGMLAGMWVGMMEAMGRVGTAGEAALLGAYVGFGAWALTWGMNAVMHLRGPKHG